MSDVDICKACNRPDPPSKRGKKSSKAKKKLPVEWINCDGCSEWYHTICVGIHQTCMPEIQKYWYFCEQCAPKGNLVLKSEPINVVSNNDLEHLKNEIQALSAKLQKLQDELTTIQAGTKKQMQRLQNQIQVMIRTEAKCEKNDKILNNIDQKLEIIESGVKLAETCSQNVNGFRIALNKIPVQQGENIKSIVERTLDILDMPEAKSRVTNCFRLPYNPSKWTDRSISPTIVIVFDGNKIRQSVLQKYYERHKDFRLCNLGIGMPLDYRFTMNEVLSISSFRARNLALRMKQKKLVRSVFVRHDSVSVLLPGNQRYTPVKDSQHLLELVRFADSTNDSSVFSTPNRLRFPFRLTTTNFPHELRRRFQK